jgi:hypothetical protein
MSVFQVHRAGIAAAVLLSGLGLVLWTQTGFAAEPASSQAAETLPMVPPAGPGVYSQQKKGAAGFRLVVTGHKFTSRDEVEKYLAYRAAELTMAQKANWFTLTETRVKTDTAEVPKRDQGGKRYSFRMEYWRPVWRYKLAGDTAWKNWSPFSGAAFFADGVDPKTIAAFEVSADITLRSGPMDDANPLAYEAGAVSDLLVNQVSPPV